MPLSVKYVLCKLHTRSPAPIEKLVQCRVPVIPVLEREARVHPWSSLASQIGVFQDQ